MGNQNQYTSNTNNASGAGSASNTNNTDTAAQTATATAAAGQGIQAGGTQNAAGNGGSSNAVPTNGADDMLGLMGQNQKTCVLGQWMKCMRKPALSMQYTLNKRHIPDMDNDPTGQTAIKGANSDTMSVTGGFTIRYFDRAAGAMLMMAAGCVLKGMCCVRKWM